MSSEKGEATRKRILETAWRILESDDPAKSRMSDIAKQAGISRQALYLHFPSRSELLVATARYLDEVKDIDALLAPSRTAVSGKERLREWVEVWANYIPEIYGVGAALMRMMDSDEAARDAWADRMQAVRHGCAAAVEALAKDSELSDEWNEEAATDWLWTLLSVRNWELLVRQCGWEQTRYVRHIQSVAGATLTQSAAPAP